MSSGLALKLMVILSEHHLMAHAFPDHASIWNLHVWCLTSWNISCICLSPKSYEQKRHRCQQGPKQICFHIPTSRCISHVLWTNHLILLGLSPSLLSFLPSFSLSLPPFFLKQILCVKHCPKHFAKRSHLILRTTYKAETTIFIILIYRLGYFGMRNLINSPVLTQPVSGWVKIQTHILWTSFLHSATLPLLSAKNNNQ